MEVRIEFDEDLQIQFPANDGHFPVYPVESYGDLRIGMHVEYNQNANYPGNWSGIIKWFILDCDGTVGVRYEPRPGATSGGWDEASKLRRSHKRSQADNEY